MSYAETDHAHQSTPETPSSSTKSVLIVDDNATNRKLLREVLQAEGYLTTEAEDGVDALSVLSRQLRPVDIIVCDVLMPNMDGYRLCREVRGRPEFKDLFFILYTATDFTSDDEKMGLDLGADRFISKEGSIRSILKTIDELMGAEESWTSTHQQERQHGRNGDSDLVPPDGEMKVFNARLVRQLEENSIELEQARVELRRLNNDLEERVIQRTTQLEVFNAQLEQWVADRTEELAAKNAILELRTQELARSNSDLEQFAYAASHDLQEPLRAVSGCIQIFERKYRAGTLGERGGEELVAMVVDGAARMKELIDGLLAYSRAGQDERVDVINTSDVLKQVLGNLSVSIGESGAEIEADKLPAMRFSEHQLGQVLQNLVGNAIKYRGAAPPKIKLSAQRHEEAWVFSVVDNGIGFEEQYAEQIFGIFQRLHTRTQYPGTGIGLAIVKRIIERRGGKIWAQSRAHQGSSFFFSVPDNVPSH